MKTFLTYFLVLIMGLGMGLLGFQSFSKTEFYEKLTKGETKIQKARITQEALPIVYINDPDVGPMLLPNTKIHVRNDPYYDSTVITNSDGFTGRNYPLITDNYRIAILGDSAVEGYKVADTNRFTFLTELMVFQKTKRKKKVEVMGFGISGWGTAHQFAALKKFVLKYNPDEVWVMFCVTNDTGDNTPLLNGPPNGPTYIYEHPDSDKIIDVKFGYSDLPEALQAERVRRYGHKALRETWKMWDMGLLPYFWSDQPNPLWELIMGQTYQVLGLMKKLCDTKDIPLTVIYRKTGYDKSQKHLDAYQKQAEDFVKHDLPMKIELGFPRFQKRLKEMGIDIINTWEMKEPGIINNADEAENSKHFQLAGFLSDKIIERFASKKFTHKKN